MHEFSPRLVLLDITFSFSFFFFLGGGGGAVGGRGALFVVPDFHELCTTLVHYLCFCF